MEIRNVIILSTTFGILALVIFLLIGQKPAPAQAAVYSPTTNIKSYSLNSSFVISNPTFYTSQTDGLFSGYLKMAVNVTNNSPRTISVRVPFEINGNVVNENDNDRIFTIPAGQTIVVTSRQLDMSLGMMDAIASIASDDGSILYAQKSVIVVADNFWHLVSVSYQTWYDVAPTSATYKLGTGDGLVNAYTEFFNCGNSAVDRYATNYIDIPLSKVGNPTGPAMIGIIQTNDSGFEPTMIKMFGSIDASTLTTSQKYYRFYAPDVYALNVCDDHIGIIYDTVNPTGSYIQTYSSTSDVFGGSADRSRYSVNLGWMTSNIATDAAMKIGIEPYLNVENGNRVTAALSLSMNQPV